MVWRHTTSVSGTNNVGELRLASDGAGLSASVSDRELRSRYTPGQCLGHDNVIVCRPACDHYTET